MSDTPEPKTPQVTVLSFKKLDLRIPAGDEPAGSVITPYVRDDVIFLDKNPPPGMPRGLPFDRPAAADINECRRIVVALCEKWKIDPATLGSSLTAGPQFAPPPADDTPPDEPRVVTG